MRKIRHLSWENFSTTIIVPGEKRHHRVGGNPTVDIFADGESNRIGLWVECSLSEEISPELQRLAAVQVRHVTSGGRELLEISTSRRQLFRAFYLFAVSVADGILQDGKTPLDAITFELQSLAALLDSKPLMGLERQVGLLGELLVLERLLRQRGAEGLSSWIGPRGEPHDFRMKKLELEVKTTTGTRRIHTIHGTQQLIPTPGHLLHIVSVLLAPPGSEEGFSLATQINMIRALIPAGCHERGEFETLLEACDYRSLDHDLYSRRFALRRPLAVAQIDDRFPTLTTASLIGSLGERAARIEAVQYDVNIEGLEFEEGAETFCAGLGPN